MNENDNITETNEQTAAEEPELNDEGVPRPAPDPRNALYTFLSLLIFAVLYIGWKYASANLLTPYSRTAFSFSDEIVSVLEEETNTPLPDDAEISFARLSSGTDNNLLRIRYSGISDEEDFAETIGFDYGDVTEDSRVAVFRDESFDVDYVFADIYVSNDDPDFSCMIYEYNGILCAEFSKTKYDSAVRSAFSGCTKYRTAS